MKVVILTEGGKNSGFGHITRCIAISQGFNEKGIIPEIYINGDESIDSFIKEINYKKYNWLDKNEKFIANLKDTDILIIDSYLIDEKYCSLLSEKVKNIVFIDDYNRINYPKGIVLNGSIGAKYIDYPKNNKIKYLLGTEYQPLRKEFWNAKPITIKKDIENILITMGGSDVRGITPTILKLVKKVFPNKNKNIMVTNAYKNISEIRKQTDNRTFIHMDLEIEDLIKLYLISDMSISGAGQTVYELAIFGIPSILIELAENQKNNLGNFEKTKSILSVGLWHENCIKKISSSLIFLNNKDIRISFSNKMLSLINGRSTINLIDNILGIS